MSTRRVDWRAITLGAAVATFVAVAASLLARPLSPSEQASQYALFAIMLAGFGVGGLYAGRKIPAYPLLNGSLSGVLAWSVLLAVTLALNAGQLDTLNPFKYAFLGVVASFAGLVGGVLASSLERRRLADPDRNQNLNRDQDRERGTR